MNKSGVRVISQILTSRCEMCPPRRPTGDTCSREAPWTGWMLLWSLRDRAFIPLVLWRLGEGPMGIGLWV